MNTIKILLLLYIYVITFVKNENDIVNDVEVLKNTVWEGYATDIGANYYVYSPYKTGYSSVTSFIQLPEKLNTNNARVACISFGVSGLYSALDLGIRNKGTGWYPFHFDTKTQQLYEHNGYMAPKETKIVGLQIDINSNKQVMFYITFRDSNAKVLKYFNKKIDSSHILVYENKKVINRFYRFVSFPPIIKGQDNKNDGTYMIGGKFTGLTIVRDNVCYPWGLHLDDVDVAWKVSPKRIDTKFYNEDDYFDIIHDDKDDIATDTTEEIDDIDKMEPIRNTWGDDCYQKEVGAHYYAYSEYTTGYSKVTGEIILPKKDNLILRGVNGEIRIAYISFGVLSKYKGLDIGIMNGGYGWYPCYNDMIHGEFKNDDSPVPSDAKSVYLEIEITNDQIINFVFTYKNEDSNPIGGWSKSIDCKDNFETKSGKVLNRFFRFASLVPKEDEKDNQKDKTLLKAEFKDLTIIKNGSKKSWGINGNDILDAWKVSPSRITINPYYNGESFSIYHHP